jgi:lipopolysaccharide transport system ATP-binding protein
MKSISVRGVAKEFVLASQQQNSRGKRFVALDDVSFDVEPGEIVGIIGRNGAGKSTLLKILARILRPTRGRIELRGRVGSLLEVGSGFHPELTGRENIFLNAAILGMDRAEIAKKFDAIVDFAGFEEHLDQPVKHYSSGMYMRLAFAVAAHVEPEILLMDEVLAVGDADFQRKCIDRIEKVGRSGQTVLFVSHDIPAVLRLCHRAVLLHQGRIAASGLVRDVAARYLDMSGGQTGEQRYPDPLQAPGDGIGRLRLIRVRSADGPTLASVDIGEAFGIEMEFDILTAGMTVFPSLVVNNQWGPICWTTDASTPWHGRPRPAGKYRVTAWFPKNFLTAGRMTVTAALTSFTPYAVHFRESDIAGFQALEAQAGSRGHFTGYIDGGIRPWLRWDVEFEEHATRTWIPG